MTRAPAIRPEVPLGTSLIRRLSEFAHFSFADPEPPLPHDDLTRINGIGPRLAERLSLLGLARFDQIAALSAIDVRRLSVILGLGRIISSQDWIGQAAALRDEASATKAETDESQHSVSKPKHMAGGLLDALKRKANEVTTTPKGGEPELDIETESERVTEQATMPQSPGRLSDFFALEGIDNPLVVGDSPPPLAPEVLQGAFRNGYEQADESTDDERGLHMIAELTAMPSLEPDCAEMSLEAPDRLAEEAEIAIIERAFVPLDDDADPAESNVDRTSMTAVMSSYENEAPEINAATRAGYFDDLNEATVEIVEVGKEDEADDLLNPRNSERARRKFFKALTGDGP